MRHLIILLVCVLNLSACGQTGDLYLPDEAEVPVTTAPASAPAP